MAYWRFGASILVAFIGDVLLGFGFLSLVNQIQLANTKLADDTLEAYYKAVMPPFLIGYGFLLVATVCVVATIFMGCLAVPKWFVLLNPFVFLFVVIGIVSLL